MWPVCHLSRLGATPMTKLKLNRENHDTKVLYRACRRGFVFGLRKSARAPIPAGWSGARFRTRRGSPRSPYSLRPWIVTRTNIFHAPRWKWGRKVNGQTLIKAPAQSNSQSGAWKRWGLPMLSRHLWASTRISTALFTKQNSCLRSRIHDRLGTGLYPHG